MAKDKEDTEAGEEEEEVERGVQRGREGGERYTPLPQLT